MFEYWQEWSSKRGEGRCYNKEKGELLKDCTWRTREADSPLGRRRGGVREPGNKNYTRQQLEGDAENAD